MRLDPADFTTEITNPYWPMSPGDRWVYRETDGQGGEQKVEVTVTDGTKPIAGIEALVVHDVVTEDGELVEDTFDWYAQDVDGNIWYLGEAYEGVRERQGEDDRRLVGARSRRRPGRRRRPRRAPSRASPTGRSTTQARPRTPPQCCHSTSGCRCLRAATATC